MAKSGDKQTRLDLALAGINKEYGKRSAYQYGKSKPDPVAVISTGSKRLNEALTVGGLPRGRIVEIYGPESSGKTTIALHVIAEAQKMGGSAAFIDVEHALDLTYTKAIGVDVPNLVLAQPDDGETALAILDRLIRSNALDVIVVDSVAALVPRAELEGEVGDSHIGLQARLMGQTLRMITGAVARSNTIVIFINQIRYKIGVFFGSPETTAGGAALKFYASVRLDIRRTGSVKVGTELTGNTVKIKVAKNKVGPPFKIAETIIMFGVGIDKVSELLEDAITRGIVIKSGTWFSIPKPKDGEEIRMQGTERFKDMLREDEELYDWMMAEVIKKEEQEVDLRIVTVAQA